MYRTHRYAWIETSEAPIVVRWRVLMQSFDFQIRHIPGKENCVADWLSRMYPIEQTPSLCPLLDAPEEPALSLEDMCRSVHGERRLHWGAAETWRRAKLKYPEAKISMSAVSEYVRNCAMCQKTRDTGIKGLPSATLTLKKGEYRKTVGIDHLTVTPPDKDGNKCVILIVEHFSHFPVAYPAKSYDAETVAKTLFKHICTYGVFDQLASDPGSAFMSDVVQQLNQWIGWHHKVSLVGRHQSNGCEGTGKQVLRHLKTLVLDERLHDRWGSDEVLPLINFHLASFPTSETGGLTPFELKYGSADYPYYRLPPELADLPVGAAPEFAPHPLLLELNRNIGIIRTLSLKLQEELVAERAAANGPLPQYDPGDLVLWEQRESPSDFLPEKLAPSYLGPYKVISQLKNDVAVEHVVLGTPHVLHVGRLKPFVGSHEDAVRVGKADQHQVFIVSINYFTGNPRVRSSMLFNVTFEDGTIDLPYNPDLAASQQFQEYILGQPDLFPLRSTAAEALKRIRQRNKLTITTIAVGDHGYLSLRFFDGPTSMWFDSLQLPNKHLRYMVPFVATTLNRKQTTVSISVPLFGEEYRLQTYDLLAHTVVDFDPNLHQVVTSLFLTNYPRILHG